MHTSVHIVLPSCLCVQPSSSPSSTQTASPTTPTSKPAHSPTRVPTTSMTQTPTISLTRAPTTLAAITEASTTTTRPLSSTYVPTPPTRTPQYAAEVDVSLLLADSVIWLKDDLSTESPTSASTRTVFLRLDATVEEAGDIDLLRIQAEISRILKVDPMAIRLDIQPGSLIVRVMIDADTGTKSETLAQRAVKKTFSCGKH